MEANAIRAMLNRLADPTLPATALFYRCMSRIKRLPKGESLTCLAILIYFVSAGGAAGKVLLKVNMRIFQASPSRTKSVDQYPLTNTGPFWLCRVPHHCPTDQISLPIAFS